MTKPNPRDLPVSLSLMICKQPKQKHTNPHQIHPKKPPNQPLHTDLAPTRSEQHEQNPPGSQIRANQQKNPNKFNTDPANTRNHPKKTHHKTRRRRARANLGVEDLAVGGEGGFEGAVVGGPGEAADEAAVLNIRRRHAFPPTPEPKKKPKSNRTRTEPGGGGEANPPLRDHGEEDCTSGGIYSRLRGIRGRPDRIRRWGVRGAG